MSSEHHGEKVSVDAEVIIVGAGLAGLYSAYRLLQASVTVLVIEADNKAGGRVFSRPERHSHLGLMLDEGANLINSTDTLAIRLMNQFGISYVRRLKPGSDSMHYLVDGNEYDQASLDRLLFLESRVAMNHIALDQDLWRQDPERDVNPMYIDESIASYIQRIEAGTVLKTLLKSFFWSEYGHALEDLNLHVLFDYLEIDLSCPCFQLIPNVDEAYTVPGGTGQIAEALEKACHPYILYGCKVTCIAEDDSRITVSSCNRDGAITLHRARQVFFAAPLHSLQKISVSVEGLSAQAVARAGLSSYARGTKLHLKFMEGFHQLYRYTGILLTDTGEQIWPSSTGQGGAGLLTVLTGPVPPGRASAVAHTGRMLQALDRICPGLSELFVSMERTDAPMSYSGSLRPGEVAKLDIHKGGAHWITVGEASSSELQGYLEGALRTADAGVIRYIAGRRLRKLARIHKVQARAATGAVV